MHEFIYSWEVYCHFFMKWLKSNSFAFGQICVFPHIIIPHLEMEFGIWLFFGHLLSLFLLNQLSESNSHNVIQFIKFEDKLLTSISPQLSVCAGYISKPTIKLLKHIKQLQQCTQSCTLCLLTHIFQSLIEAKSMLSTQPQHQAAVVSLQSHLQVWRENCRC